MPSLGTSGRPARLAALLAATLATALAGAPAAGAQPACQSTNARAAQAGEQELVGATLCLLNAERNHRGLRALRQNGDLSQAARRHARDMARRDYFSHTSLSGASFVDRIRRTGYLRSARGWAVGENLAWGSRGRSTPRSIVRAWMRSAGHRANVLHSRYRDIGLAVVFDAPAAISEGPAATYATTFGART